ncbi:hypothetical protein MLD38_012530 [Melastoma candidum]|uniref:Uncharacterized protein n=1 Tax=Melastoma candidum TaxID=119954 RepID=A0ACB9R6N4_9MYRT|nr:hypothetical protein MLD38_012530 [Melastoma candidum]
METAMTAWMTVILGVIPLLAWVLWSWNELRYVVPAVKKCSVFGSMLPPGRMGLPYFGEMFVFLWHFKIIRRPDEYIDRMRQKYGDGVGMFRTHLFGKPSIITCLPEVNKFVLQTNSHFELEWPAVELVGRASMVAVQGKQHERIRRFVVDAINKPDALRRITQLVQPRIVAALQSWAEKGRVITYKESKKVTFENIGKLFASMEPGPELEELLAWFDGLVKGFRALPLNLPGTAYRHALKCRKKLEAVFEERMEMRKRNPNEGANKDLLDGLMEMRDEQGNKLTDRELVDNIVSIVVAGFESTTLSIMWAVYYLAKYPDILEKLREENRAIARSRNGEFITSEDVPKMVYTSKVVEETIRLANIALLLFRKVKNDVDYKGYRIPKDWTVILWVRYLHTNPENFDDPLRFNPDRWDKMAKPGSYLVFGGGSRICAGNMLVRYQLAILLHHLSLGYRWELVNPDAGFKYLPHNSPVDGAEIAIQKL